MFDQWLAGPTEEIAGDILICLAEIPGSREGVLDGLRAILRSHYVSPDLTARRLVQLGAEKTARLLLAALPQSKKARSGDLGEFLATELAERRLGFEVPIRRLRWRDDREMALRGDDLIGVKRTEQGKWIFLKGEAKSRGKLAKNVVSEASRTLDKEEGRPSRHAVLFVVARLSEIGRNDVARALEDALLESFEGSGLEQLLFTVSGNDPSGLLRAHLESRAGLAPRRHAIGVRVEPHSVLVQLAFDGP
ncbi:MAG: Hachiman antiphage defense system protein HamA [Thermoanaerobaculia bacterium]